MRFVPMSIPSRFFDCNFISEAQVIFGALLILLTLNDNLKTGRIFLSNRVLVKLPPPNHLIGSGFCSRWDLELAMAPSIRVCWVVTVLGTCKSHGGQQCLGPQLGACVKQTTRLTTCPVDFYHCGAILVQVPIGLPCQMEGFAGHDTSGWELSVGGRFDKCCLAARLAYRGSGTTVFNQVGVQSIDVGV